MLRMSHVLTIVTTLEYRCYNVMNSYRFLEHQNLSLHLRRNHQAVNFDSVEFYVLNWSACTGKGMCTISSAILNLSLPNAVIAQLSQI